MDTPSAGAVILVRFPFSDLSQNKLRPAIVLASAGGDDWILCQVTSRPYNDPRALELKDVDFAEGTLQRLSFARPTKLFTASNSIVTKTVGHLTEDSRKRVSDVIVDVLRRS